MRARKGFYLAALVFGMAGCIWFLLTVLEGSMNQPYDPRAVTYLEWHQWVVFGVSMYMYVVCREKV